MQYGGDFLRARGEESTELSTASVDKGFPWAEAGPTLD
jgi:hypothetical protein